MHQPRIAAQKRRAARRTALARERASEPGQPAALGVQRASSTAGHSRGRNTADDARSEALPLTLAS
eukprot:6212420-Pleurochrysis_carterae.AAC.4